MRCGSRRAIAASSPSLLAEAEVMYENLGESGPEFRGVRSFRRRSTVFNRAVENWLN